MEYVLEKAERQANQPWDNVIRVKGLPFKVFQNPSQGLRLRLYLVQYRHVEKVLQKYGNNK